MILVLLGTQNNSFVRLLQEIEKNIQNGKINEKVIVQSGYTQYQSKVMEIHDMISPQEMDELVKQSRIIITHGGVGSILHGVKYGKPVIAVPRLHKYNEHVNDHQVQLINTFNDKGYIIGLKDLSELEEAISKAEKFTPEKFESNTENIIKLIDEFIEKN